MRLAIRLLTFTLPLLLMGCINLPASLFGNNRGQLSTEVIEPAPGFWNVNEILIIPLDGMVAEGSESSHLRGEPGMLVGLKDRLDAARKNPFIRAIILRIDSPGGTITASDLIYREIMRFKAQKDSKGKSIPIIAQFNGTAASGGVYIAMAADEIYALPSTVTGSIGCVAMLPNVKELADKIGFKMNVIKSGKNKDIGSPFGNMTDEQQGIFQGMIDSFFHRFYKLVLDARAPHGMTDEMLRPLADGRVMDAQTALGIHLIDGIKFPDQVIARARELAGIKRSTVISYEYSGNYRGNIYAAATTPQPQAAHDGGHGESRSGDFNLFKLDAGSWGEQFAGAQFYYLWVQ